MAHLGHRCYLIAPHRMIYSSSNSCTAFAWQGGHASGHRALQAVLGRHKEHAVAEFQHQFSLP